VAPNATINSSSLELKQGTQFDPRLVEAFVNLIRREFWEHDNFDAFLAEGADESSMYGPAPVCRRLLRKEDKFGRCADNGLSR
jgi:hypothetical protein